MPCSEALLRIGVLDLVSALFPAEDDIWITSTIELVPWPPRCLLYRGIIEHIPVIFGTIRKLAVSDVVTDCPEITLVHNNSVRCVGNSVLNQSLNAAAVDGEPSGNEDSGTEFLHFAVVVILEAL